MVSCVRAGLAGGGSSLDPAPPACRRQRSYQGKQSKAAAESFQEFCHQLWLDFPDLEREQPDDTVGVTLLKHHRTAEALPVLLREAYALNIGAHTALVRLYEEGLEGVPNTDSGFWPISKRRPPTG